MNKEKEEKLAEISARIMKVITFLGETPNSFATKLGYPRAQTIYDIQKMKSAPSYDFFQRFSKAGFSAIIDLDWLFTGEGSMLRTQKKEPVVIEHKPSIELIPSTDDNTVTVPIVEISVAAGTAGYCNSDYMEVVDGIKMPASMLHRNSQYYCIRVKGDSMAPTILDSSYVIVRLLERSEWENIRDQHVYVISDREGRAYLKRLKNRFREHGFVTCMSDNPDKANYGNFNIWEEEINSILYAEFYISAKMPNIHETYYKEVGELRDDMDVLKEQMKQVMKTIKTIN